MMKNLKQYRIIFYTLFFSNLFLEVAFGQEEDSQKESLFFYKYSPSILLYKGQYEIKIFNNLYTQKAYFNQNSERIDDAGRSTYFTSIIHGLYGISEKVNLGVCTFFRSVRLDEVSSLPFSVLKFEKSTDTRTAISQIGPVVRFSPFQQNINLSVQSTILFPVAKDLEGISNNKPFLDFDKYTWWTQVFYDKIINNRWVIFAETDILLRLDKQFVLLNSIFSTPVKLFAGTYLTDNTGIYLMSEWAPVWGLKPLLAAYYLQSGMGVKYQILKNLELEILYTRFLAGKNQGAGETYNLGLKFIK